MSTPVGARPSPANQTAPKHPLPEDSYAGGTQAQPIEDVSVGQLIGDISRDLSTLMRQEMELAKAELKSEVQKGAKGAGMLGGAGFAGYMFVVFLSLTAAWGLGDLLDNSWLGHGLVMLFWGIVAAVLFVTGRKTLKTVHPKPERTVETVQQIPPALKPNR